MIPCPAEHFAHPPYQAELLNAKTGWATVVNCNGTNCLTFKDKPGATVTSWNAALRIAEIWNRQTK